MSKNKFSGFMGGRANFLGLMIYDVWGGSAESRYYKLGRAIMLILEGSLIVSTGGFSLYLSSIGTISALWLLFLILLTILATYLRIFRLLLLEIIFKTPYIGTNLKEWHAIEHKLGHILDGEIKDLTLENLRKAPFLQKRCRLTNQGIKEPSEEKLKEALEVGRRYLTPHFPTFF